MYTIYYFDITIDESILRAIPASSETEMKLLVDFIENSESYLLYNVKY